MHMQMISYNDVTNWVKHSIKHIPQLEREHCINKVAHKIRASHQTFLFKDKTSCINQFKTKTQGESE